MIYRHGQEGWRLARYVADMLGAILGTPDSVMEDAPDEKIGSTRFGAIGDAGHRL